MSTTGAVATHDIALYVSDSVVDVAGEVRDDEARQRYELVVDGAVVGVAVYRRADGVTTFVHTEVPEAYEGRGYGGQLARGALDDVRARAERVVARCPFIAAYLERHPEYADLVS